MSSSSSSSMRRVPPRPLHVDGRVARHSLDVHGHSGNGGGTGTASAGVVGSSAPPRSPALTSSLSLHVAAPIYASLESASPSFATTTTTTTAAPRATRYFSPAPPSLASVTAAPISPAPSSTSHVYSATPPRPNSPLVIFTPPPVPHAQHPHQHHHTSSSSPPHHSLLAPPALTLTANASGGAPTANPSVSASPYATPLYPSPSFPATFSLHLGATSPHVSPQSGHTPSRSPSACSPTPPVRSITGPASSYSPAAPTAPYTLTASLTSLTPSRTGAIAPPSRPAVAKNIQVFVRIRPPLLRELDDPLYHTVMRVQPDRQTLNIAENMNEAAALAGTLPASSSTTTTTSSSSATSADANGGTDLSGLYGLHTFTFDRVFVESSSQDEVFEEAGRPAVLAILTGYNATVMCYGQTGTGKTYTMEGFADADQRGLLPRSVLALFAYINASGPNKRFLMRASYFQLYQETITDLLMPDRVNLQIREDKKRGVHIEHLSEWVVKNEQQVLALVRKGSARRTTHGTRVNETSSRSHAVFTIILEQHETSTDVDEQGGGEEADDGASPDDALFGIGGGGGAAGRSRSLSSSSTSSSISSASTLGRGGPAGATTPQRSRLPHQQQQQQRPHHHVRQTYTMGKLNLVDLAGSERIRVSGATSGARLNESKAINSSLSTLTHVISSLVDRKPHVPYRDSKLTRILEDSLGGNTCMVMLGTLGPSYEAYAENVSTLKFMTRARRIENTVKVNVQTDQQSLLRRYERELRQLRSELDERNQHLKSQRMLLDLEEQKRRAEEDRRAALARMEQVSLDLMREKKKKSELETKIREMSSQMLSGSSSSASSATAAAAALTAANATGPIDVAALPLQQLLTVPAFQTVLHDTEERIRRVYEKRWEELEQENQRKQQQQQQQQQQQAGASVGAGAGAGANASAATAAPSSTSSSASASTSNDDDREKLSRYRDLVLKQRQIIMELVRRMGLADAALKRAKENASRLEARTRELEDALDQKRLRVIQLRKTISSDPAEEDAVDASESSAAAAATAASTSAPALSSSSSLSSSSPSAPSVGATSATSAPDRVPIAPSSTTPSSQSSVSSSTSSSSSPSASSSPPSEQESSGALHTVVTDDLGDDDEYKGARRVSLYHPSRPRPQDNDGNAESSDSEDDDDDDHDDSDDSDDDAHANDVELRNGDVVLDDVATVLPSPIERAGKAELSRSSNTTIAPEHERTIADLQETIRVLHARLHAQQATVDQQRETEQHRELEQQREQQQQLQQERDRLVADARTLREQMAQLARERESIEQHERELDAQVTSLNEHVRTLQQDQSRLVAEHQQRMDDERTRLRDELAREFAIDLERERQQLREQLREQVSRERSERLERDAQVDRLTRQLADVRGQHDQHAKERAALIVIMEQKMKVLIDGAANALRARSAQADPAAAVDDSARRQLDVLQRLMDASLAAMKASESGPTTTAEEEAARAATPTAATLTAAAATPSPSSSITTADASTETTLPLGSTTSSTSSSSSSASSSSSSATSSAFSASPARTPARGPSPRNSATQQQPQQRQPQQQASGALSSTTKGISMTLDTALSLQLGAAIRAHSAAASGTTPSHSRRTAAGATGAATAAALPLASSARPSSSSPSSTTASSSDAPPPTSLTRSSSASKRSDHTPHARTPGGARARTPHAHESSASSSQRPRARSQSRTRDRVPADGAGGASGGGGGGWLDSVDVADFVDEFGAGAGLDSDDDDLDYGGGGTDHHIDGATSAMATMTAIHAQPNRRSRRTARALSTSTPSPPPPAPSAAAVAAAHAMRPVTMAHMQDQARSRQLDLTQLNRRLDAFQTGEEDMFRVWR